MTKLVEFLSSHLPFLAAVPHWALYAGVTTAVALGIALGAVAPLAGFFTFAERRVAAAMQARIGPNRVGPQGLLQFPADAVKLLMKEDIVPAATDRVLFVMAPYVCFAGSFLTFVVLPLGATIYVTNLNLGILYILAVTSIVVIGIIMSGWASNNKWSLYGGMRGAAQVISYEIPVGLSILTVIFHTGSLSMVDISEYQKGAGGLLGWFLFNNPFTFVAFFVYFTAALAEINRTPFDIPEAESELVSGYHTEYSGMRFAIFFLAEFANMFIVGMITAVLFLGGYNGPIVNGPHWILLKALFLVFVMMWLRWTLPRLRVDQLMNLCWKYLLPIAFVNMLGSALWAAAMPGRRFFGLIAP
ncbi:MAG: NADH-quinone oxidoreductase subunit NuoH [Myxococcales bacterium]|nr:NADH-quinone oxidoreductase subunit NuoH [Myxococcales bacterium]